MNNASNTILNALLIIIYLLVNEEKPVGKADWDIHDFIPDVPYNYVYIYIVYGLHRFSSSTPKKVQPKR